MTTKSPEPIIIRETSKSAETRKIAELMGDRIKEMRSKSAEMSNREAKIDCLTDLEMSVSRLLISREYRSLEDWQGFKSLVNDLTDAVVSLREYLGVSNDR